MKLHLMYYILFRFRVEILCQKCGKKYKTRGGYERHQASKHSERADRQVPFDSAVLNEFKRKTWLFPKLLRQELSSYRFESPDEDRYQQLRDIFEGYTKNFNKVTVTK